MRNKSRCGTVLTGQKKRLALSALLFMIGIHIFAVESTQKILAGWQISPGITAVEENGKAILSTDKKQGSIFRYLPENAEYIQFRIEKCSRFYMAISKFKLPVTCPMPGLYTIPATGDMSESNSVHLYFFPKEFVFSEFQSFTEPGANSVTVTKNGDEIVISMPVEEKPDSLSLTLYVADSGKNWKFKGRWTQLDWPGVPTSLTLEADGIYRARFKLPTLPEDFSAPALTMIAGVRMAGRDNVSLGDYYGFFPFEVKIQASKRQTSDMNLKIYDLGPKDAAPQAGAVREDKAIIWTGLSGFKSSTARIPYLDRLLSSWAEVQPGQTAKAILKLDKGKYHLSIGLGSTTLPSYAMRKHQPTSGCVKINGKEVFRRNSADQDRDFFIRRYADENDNIYRLYFKGLTFFDIDTEVEVMEEEVLLEFIADPHKIMVLNYITVHPIENQEAEERLARIRSIREEVYNQHLVLEKPNQKPFPMKTPFSVFALENPDDTLRPDTLPTESETHNPLTLFGASDEILSGTFIVRTGSEKICGLNVNLTGLAGELSQIMYVHHSAGSLNKAWVGANHLLPAEPVDLKPFYTYGWRLRMKGPAHPGKYCGNIEVTAEGHTEKLPVEVTIHPLKLPELNDHLIAMDGDGIAGPHAADLMRFAKEELGCTTAHLRMSWPTTSKFELDENGMPVKVISVGGYNTEKYDAWLDAYVKADFPVKTPWIGLMSITSSRSLFNQGPFKPFTKEYCQAVKLSYEFLRDRAQKKGLTGILVDLGGEMGVGLSVPSEQVISSAIEFIKLVNAIPGVQTSYRCNCYATVEGFNPYLDIQGVRGKFSWKSSDRVTDFGRKKHIYTYSVGGRFQNGFESWAHGARGNLREYMFFDHPYYRHTPSMGNTSTTHDESAMSGVDKPLVTVRTEAFRASVVDRQYLRLLDDAIWKAPESEARSKAEALRDLLQNTCLNYGIKETRSEESSPWECMRLDLMRRAIVECILNLRVNQAAAIPEYRKIARTDHEEKPEVPKIDPKEIPEAAKQNFDDAMWPQINTGSWESQGYHYDGCAWYRNTFDLKDLQNPRIIFEGVDEQAWVWLNDKFLGHHDGWNEPFSFPLDQAALEGKNTLCVLVFDSAFQGGIWRPVKVVNGPSAQVLNQWKFILAPGKQDLNIFQLKNGPLVSTGDETLHLSLLLYGFPDVRMSQDMEIHLDGEKLPVKVIPYQRIELAIPVAPISKGAHQMTLKSAGKIVMTYDFYGI